MGVRAAVPGDVEGRQALFGGPHMIRDHSHRIVEAHYLVHTLDGFRIAIVEARQFAANHRASGHCGDLHAGDFDVDAELRLAVHLVWCIEALDRLADQLEVFGIF